MLQYPLGVFQLLVYESVDQTVSLHCAALMMKIFHHWIGVEIRIYDATLHI